MYLTQLKLLYRGRAQQSLFLQETITIKGQLWEGFSSFLDSEFDSLS